MSSDTVINIENLSKRYVIGRQRCKDDGLRHVAQDLALAPWRWLRKVTSSNGANGDGNSHLSAPSSLLPVSCSEEFWALRDVNLEVKQGEVLGIIGRNGAGKSTLLKILSRITEPTNGQVRIKGRVASLLEVGTGFHPELTGRENIFLNGAILGMSRAEIIRKFDEIVAFAEIEKFLDTPVKRYSSGMYVRLAFAVAAHLEPEILIVDEVLAVGDAEFQKKCLARMDDVAHKEGRTVLFVSHNMAAITNLCTSCALLAAGRVDARGRTEQVTRRYLDQAQSIAAESKTLAERRERSGSGAIKLTTFHIEDGIGNPISCAASGTDLIFVFGYLVESSRLPKKVDVGFSLSSNSGQLLLVLYSSYQRISLDPLVPAGSFRCKLERLPIAAGRYLVHARLLVDNEEADWPCGGAGVLEVVSGDYYGTGSLGFGTAAPLLMDGKWSVTGSERA